MIIDCQHDPEVVLFLVRVNNPIGVISLRCYVDVRDTGYADVVSFAFVLQRLWRGHRGRMDFLRVMRQAQKLEAMVR